jgi:hypothetical protein
MSQWARPTANLTTNLQRAYDQAIARAGEVCDDEVAGFHATAQEVLDGKGVHEWVEWAGEGLMPETARAKREVEEKEQQAAEEAERERVEREAEARAEEFTRRRQEVEARFNADTLTFEDLERELDAIQAEEDKDMAGPDDEKDAGEEGEQEIGEPESGDENDGPEKGHDEEEEEETVPSRITVPGGRLKRKEREEEETETQSSRGPVSTHVTVFRVHTDDKF